VPFEDLRDKGVLCFVDSLEALEAMTQKVVFFSHQWKGFSQPDEGNHDFTVMAGALQHVAQVKRWALERMLVWVVRCPHCAAAPSTHAAPAVLARLHPAARCPRPTRPTRPRICPRNGRLRRLRRLLRRLLRRRAGLFEHPAAARGAASRRRAVDWPVRGVRLRVHRLCAHVHAQGLAGQV
jgi:hypothetical protein